MTYSRADDLVEEDWEEEEEELEDWEELDADEEEDEIWLDDDEF
jgi:hypothetical protein